MENRILYVSQEDIIKSGCLNVEDTLAVVRDVIRGYADGKVLFPDKISQIFDEQTQNRINCLPATLLDEQICGMKWVSVFPTNARIELPNLSAVIVLSSIQTGFPVAFLDATVCSNLRTAGVSTIAAQYLAPEHPTAVGFVGAGQQARYHFYMLKHQFPEIRKCYISSRTETSEQEFADAFRAQYPDVEFILCKGNYETAVRNSHIVVSAISGQAPLIKAEWIDKGMLYLHIGGWEDEYGVPLKASKIVCDKWDAVKHRTQTVSRLYKAGQLHDEDIYCDIDDLVAGKVPGRTDPEEFIYFNAVGLSYVDIALANHLYKTCDRKGNGIALPLSTQPIF